MTRWLGSRVVSGAWGLALAALLSGCLSVAPPAASPSGNEASEAQTRAEALFNEHKYVEAIEEFSRVLELEPQNTWSLGMRGECYRMLSRYDEAIADFSRSLELSPDSAWDLAHRGECYRAKEDYANAIADLNRAIELNPEDSWTLGSRGDAYRLTNEFDKAIEDFSKAIRLDANYTWAIARRGEAYRMAGKYDQATADLTLAIEQAPEDSFAYASRGQVYQETGDFPKAMVDFDKAIEIDPDYKWAKERREELRQAMAKQGSAPAAGETRPSGPMPLITVLDFSIENIPKSDGRLIVDLVFSALVSIRRYRVLDRGQRDNILKEIEFSYSACVDEKCQLEIGRLLAADRIVVGSLGKVGQRFILNAKMLDVQTGEAVSTAYKVFGSLEELVDGTEGVAWSLVED
jgi:tetratricopeptide (TPR) repeat protein